MLRSQMFFQVGEEGRNIRRPPSSGSKSFSTDPQTQSSVDKHILGSPQTATFLDFQNSSPPPPNPRYITLYYFSSIHVSHSTHARPVNKWPGVLFNSQQSRPNPYPVSTMSGQPRLPGRHPGTGTGVRPPLTPDEMFLSGPSQPGNATSSSSASAPGPSVPSSTIDWKGPLEPVKNAIARIKKEESEPATRIRRLGAIHSACAGLENHLERNEGQIADISPNFASLKLDDDVRTCLKNIYEQNISIKGAQYVAGLREELARQADAGMN